ncbi:hypothetical protein JYT32_00715, partial [Dehalococcoides mccartyi]|nr:hypothetical protein [Dehalococcoides mccartyi]
QGGPTAGIFGFLPLSIRAYVLFGLGAIVLPVALMKRPTRFIRVLVLLSGISILHTGIFGIFGYVELNNWYWVTEYVTVMALIAVAFQWIITTARGTRAYWVPSVLIPAVVIFGLGPGFLKNSLQNFDFEIRDTPNYFLHAEFLETNTPGDAIIGTPNAGGVGYFTNRRVVNIDGLANSNAFLKKMTQKEGHEYLKEIGVDYIFRVGGYLKQEPYRHMLDGKLEKVGSDLYLYFPDR